MWNNAGWLEDTKCLVAPSQANGDGVCIRRLVSGRKVIHCLHTGKGDKQAFRGTVFLGEINSLSTVS